jgi:hypothetical protein
MDTFLGTPNAIRNGEEGEALNAEQHYFVYSAKAVIPAGIGQRIQAMVTMDPDSYFWVRKMYNTDNGPFSVQLRDSFLNYTWQDHYVYRDNIFGTPEYPAVLLDPILLPPRVNVIAELENFSEEENEVEIVFEGTRCYGSKIPSDTEISDSMRKRWFQYVFDDMVPANARVIKTFSANADAFFLTKKLMAVKTGDFAVRASLSSLGSRAISDKLINADNMFGRAVRPNVLPKYQRIPYPPNSIAQFELQDLSGANNTLQIVFEGVKVWRR